MDLPACVVQMRFQVELIAVNRLSDAAPGADRGLMECLHRECPMKNVLLALILPFMFSPAAFSADATVPESAEKAREEMKAAGVADPVQGRGRP